MVRMLVLGMTVAGVLVLSGASAAFAGQPSQSCQAQPPGSTPGNSVSAPGSVFNQGGVSGNVYAGNPGTPSLANGSPLAISQYDVACFQQASH